MGLWSSVAKGLGLAPDTSGIQRGIKRAARESRGLIEGAGTFAEQQLSPYMLDPSVMQELQGVVTGSSNYRQSPIYQQYMDVGREALMEDLSAGSLYSGPRMEGVQELGQSAFSNYLNTLQGLAGFGRQTAGQMGGIRMGTAGNTANILTNQAADIANVQMAENANVSNLATSLISGAAQMYKPA